MNLDEEYNNRKRVPQHPRIFAGWEKDAADYRVGSRSDLDLAYGDHDRHKVDVFWPEEDENGPMAVFIHGGYWQGFDRSSFSHMARGLNLRGIPVAVPSYRLCPEVGVSDIIEDVRALCLWLWQRFERRLVVAGHSAGGHLAACALATDWPALDAPPYLVHGGFGISGLYDLRPLIPTSINEALKLDEQAARAASPLTWPTPRGLRFEAWVGASESGEYLRQSRTLAATWTGGGAPTSCVELLGANHFTAIAPLADPASAMTLSLSAMCGE